jgi:hypothetical protein
MPVVLSFGKVTIKAPFSYPKTFRTTLFAVALHTPLWGLWYLHQQMAKSDLEL